jgi:capsular polysaccharide biosynthesis protein
VETQDDLRPAIAAVRRRWLLVVLLTVLGAGIGYGASSMMTPVYRGTASLLVGDFKDGNVSNNEILAMQSLTATYADIARRQPVLAAAARQLGSGVTWQQLSAASDIGVPKESPQVVEISVEGVTPGWAAKAAGAIAEHLVRFVDQTSGGTDFVTPQLHQLERDIEEGQQRVDRLRSEQSSAEPQQAAELEREIERTQQQIAAWQDNYLSFDEMAATSGHVAIRALGPAVATSGPVRPDKIFNTLVATFAGLLLALAGAYVLESRRRRPEVAERRAATYPLLGPPNLSLTLPRNGVHLQDAGRSDRPAEQREGDVR